MGCCAVKDGVVYERVAVSCKRKRINFDKVAKAEKTTTEVSENTRQESEEEAEFKDYIAKLKQAYNILSYKSIWFNKGEEIQIGKTYLLETDRYNINCQITDIDQKKISSIKFALISPEVEENNHEGLLKNLIFVYCKQKRETTEKVVPVIMRIEKSAADVEKGIFNFTANINCIVKMNLTLTNKDE